MSDPPRPLTTAESRVLGLLLGVEFPGVAELRMQAASAVVVGGCNCGCPSIEIEAPGDSPSLTGLSGRLAPAEGVVSPEGDGVPEAILLFVDAGRLSYLEYVYYDNPPARWPASDRIRVIVRPR